MNESTDNANDLSEELIEQFFELKRVSIFKLKYYLI
jgi:hypothetical protein